MKLILIRGIPGSGKSTIAKSFNGVHLEADMFFMKDGEYRFDFNDLTDAHAWCRDSTINHLKNENTVIVSNTFTTKRELRPYFDIAKDFGITPNVVLAQGNFNNVHNVPLDVLEKMKARFEYDISELYETI